MWIDSEAIFVIVMLWPFESGLMYFPCIYSSLMCLVTPAGASRQHASRASDALPLLQRCIIYYMGILGTVTAVLQCGEYNAVVHRSAGGCSSSLVNYCSCNVAGVAGCHGFM